MAVRDDLISAAASRGLVKAWNSGPVAFYCLFKQYPSADYLQAGPGGGSGATLTTNAQSPYTFPLSQYFAGAAINNFQAPTRALTPVFFGWAERQPAVRHKPAYKAWHTDAGGSVHGADYWYEGAEASVSAAFTVWNERCYAVMQSYAGQNFRGQDLTGDVGRWMVADGGAFQLVMVFPYAARFPNQLDMPFGFRFFAAFLDDDGSANGAAARKLRLAWRCVRLLDPNDGSWNLYDHDVSSVANTLAFVTAPVKNF